MIVSRLTTVDNPFDPFEQFDDWFAFDEQKGYHSCALLDRICCTSSMLSYEQQNRDQEFAIDTIIRLHGNGLYKKVQKEIEE